MEVGIGGIIGGIAETGHKEQGEHHHDHPDAGRPNASDVGFADNRAPNAIEQQHNANEGHCCEKGHGKIVVEVFHRREKHLLRLRVNGITVFQKEAHKEGEEEREEGDGGTNEAHTGTRTEVFVVDIIPKLSIVSFVSRIPAVSMNRKVIPPILTVSSITSRVVP